MKNNVKKDKKTPLLYSKPRWCQTLMDLGGGAERSDGADFGPTALPQYPKKTAPPEGAGGGIYISHLLKCIDEQKNTIYQLINQLIEKKNGRQ